MKDKKNLLLLLPVLVFVLTFIGMYFINKSYAIYSDTAVVNEAVINGTKYYMVGKNTYSWHGITNGHRTAGTKLMRTKEKINGKSYDAVVYCATENESLAADSNRTRYSIDKISMKSDRKNKLKDLIPYMYPYVTLGSLKSTLKGDKGIGSNYSKYAFDKLTAQEAMTASQAAIWNIIEGYTSAHFKYGGTVDSFSAFSTCSKYYNGKVITSEEKAWYDASGCSSSGNFYKYLYNHKKDSNTKMRINTLIEWYVKSLQSKLPSSTTETFSIGSSSVNGNTLTITLDTNMTSYNVEFKDQAGNPLSASKTGNNTYTLSDLSISIKKVNVSVISKNAQNHIFYYKADHGQDFIGLEKTYYSNSQSVDVAIPTGKIIIYKVGDTEKNVELTVNSTGNFDSSKCSQSNANNQCLNGAKFKLYYEGITDEHLVEEIRLDYSNPDTYIIDSLLPGTYYLKETQPALGYNLYNQNQGELVENGFIKITIPNSSVAYDVLVNNNKNKICFAKVDAATGEYLPKGRFLVYDIDGTILEEFESSANAGQEKYCFVGQLQSGSYFIQEIEAPDGYTLDPTLYHFTVGNVGSNISNLEDLPEYKEATAVDGVITLKNSKQVSISKADVTTGVCVNGSLLIVRDENGNIVEQWTSKCEDVDNDIDDEAKICVENYDSSYTSDSDIGSDNPDDENEYVCTHTEQLNRAKESHRFTLEPGNYTLTEVMTDELKAQGYTLNTETVSFTVNADGAVDGTLKC